MRDSRRGGPRYRTEDEHGWHGRRGRMRRGDIRTVVLVALVDGPAHGYEIIQRLGDKTGGWWQPSPGSVYPKMAGEPRRVAPSRAKKQ